MLLLLQHTATGTAVTIPAAAAATTAATATPATATVTTVSTYDHYLPYLLPTTLYHLSPTATTSHLLRPTYDCCGLLLLRLMLCAVPPRSILSVSNDKLKNVYRV